jgi:hypothetical protein
MENPVDHPSLMHCDNQSAISVAENPAMHNKAKHIALKYHYIRDFVDNKDITIHYCQSGANSADLLTKILPRDATPMPPYDQFGLVWIGLRGQWECCSIDLASNPNGDESGWWSFLVNGWSCNNQTL